MGKFEDKNRKNIIRHNNKILEIMKEASAEITRRIHRFKLKHTGDTFYTGNFFKFNRQIEMTLSSGITVGRPANVMAKDLKDALIEPNRIFRRIRKDGELVLSRMAKKYHPGQGVYRSSFKNARRLAANETNMAYRTSDFTRRKQLPFVTGITVHLSPQHPLSKLSSKKKGLFFQP